MLSLCRWRNIVKSEALEIVAMAIHLHKMYKMLPEQYNNMVSIIYVLHYWRRPPEVNIVNAL
jgi:hypothetical protein